jgi:tetratricopeptide (TPR) repeat protein
MPEPSDVTARLAEALALHQAGRLAAAETIYNRILAHAPDHADALHWRGVIAHQRGDHAAAVRHIDLALKGNPDNVLALNNRGNALQALQRFDEALASYERALVLRPDFADAHCNRGNALQALLRFDEALASFARALALRPGYAEAHYNRGNALHALQRFEEALASFDRALALRPDYAEAHANRGIALHDLKRFDEALASYQRALALRPDYAEAHYSAALCCLLTGDLERGWDQHEWRWQTAQFEHGRRNFSQPQWDGSAAIAGKTVLLHAEQGFGDTIQFCRYLPLVVERGARVVLEVQRPLQDLMSHSFGAAQVLSRGETLPDFDVHCSLLSLPRAFATRLETISSATPYLRVSPQAVTAWSARLPPRTRPRIGIAWAGRPTHKNDHNRSIALDALLSLLDGVDATWISLQRDVRAADAALLQNRDDIFHYGEELKTFADTAALVANLDLVISVDTSVAHLAGALAKPVWVLLPFIPDWRWLLDRDASLWYPTARLFRQDGERAWNGVLARVRAALRDGSGELGAK